MERYKIHTAAMKRRATTGYIKGGAATYPSGATFGPRVLEDFELVWIQRGRVRYQADGREYDAPPGTVILGRPGFREKYTWDATSITRHAFFHFEHSGIPGRGIFPALAKWPIARLMPERDIIRPLFAFIVAQLARAPANQLDFPLEPVLQRSFDTVLAAFVMGPVSPDQPAAEWRDLFPEPLHRALRWMTQRVAAGDAAPVSLWDLAEAAHVSEQHLCRLFHKHVGLPPVLAHTALRLNRAIDLMARTDLKMEAVATACGFATLQHFSRRFKAFYGGSPAAVRAALLESGARPQPVAWGAQRVISYL